MKSFIAFSDIKERDRHAHVQNSHNTSRALTQTRCRSYFCKKLHDRERRTAHEKIARLKRAAVISVPSPLFGGDSYLCCWRGRDAISFDRAQDGVCERMRSWRLECGDSYQKLGLAARVRPGEDAKEISRGRGPLPQPTKCTLLSPIGAHKVGKFAQSRRESFEAFTASALDLGDDELFDCVKTDGVEPDRLESRTAPLNRLFMDLLVWFDRDHLDSSASLITGKINW